jgi:hypothetical protein
MEDVMANEPGAAVLAIFDQLIDRVKNTKLLGSDGKPISQQIFSQLVMGMPIDRRDYMNPWSPMGGASLREAPPPVPEGQPLSSDPQMEQAMRAAWNTSVLCNTMIQVSKDGHYKEYPTGRHLDFAYSGIVNGMTSKAMAEEPADLKKRRFDAQKVLYKLDAEGNIDFNAETSAYAAYQRNVEALAEARSAFATAESVSRVNRQTAAAWPVTSASLNRKVKQAYDRLVSQGAEQVERALATINSIGVPVEAYMIDKAKEEWENWNLGLSGVVPSEMPYSTILPTNWCDPDNHDGWSKLRIDQSSYQHIDSQSYNSQSASSWSSESEANSGGGGVMLGFAAFAGSASSRSSNSSWQNSSSSQFRNSFKNSAKGLTIEFEWGLCKIVRPWLISDLFYVKNWYLANQKKNAISDGTIDGQVDSQEKLLPMLPTSFLVVRNVTISATDWGEDFSRLDACYGSAQGSEEARAFEAEGGGGVSLGFISFGGTASHSQSRYSGEQSGFFASSGDGYYGTKFEGNTLTIPGAQIVAFLSDILPACPESDDPNLPA